MRNPETVLNALSSHSADSHYKYERLYRILFNEEMFNIAYQHLAPNPGNMTPGTDGHTIDQMSIPRIKNIIDSLKDESYQPKPARRVYIRKKNGKLRPLGIPSFDDKLLQEVVKMILEAIYEGHFEDTSHGFRPYRSCHTALKQIQNTFTGAKWFIEGDIKGFFDNIDHEVLINILRERIADERFLRLIYKFLKAGYIEKADYHGTYSGTPQGGTISPVLANIYLDKFDKYMKEYATNFEKGAKRMTNPKYKYWADKACRLRRKMRDESNETQKKTLLEQINQANEMMLSEPFQMPMDENFKRLKYVRYADDFLIGVIGSKRDCQEIKQEITLYMEERLKLEMSVEKTLITHSSDNAKFLGFDITVRKSQARKRDKNGNLMRPFGSKVMLNLSSETVKTKLQSYDAIRFTYDSNGKMRWMPKSRPQLLAQKPEDILAIYNSQIMGFYNYYGIANNSSSQCSAFAHIMEYSLYMTIGQKLRLSLREVINKYRKDKTFTITYEDKKGRTKRRTLYNDGFKRKNGIGFPFIDREPRTYVTPPPTLAERLKNGYCEVCGKHGNVVMHHERKLRNISDKTPWGMLMMQRGRKTLVVCEECNLKISKNVN